MSNPRGSHTITLPEGDEYTLLLDNSAVADADESFGSSVLQKFLAEPANFHVHRTLFYFGARMQHKDIRTVRQAGQRLSGVPLQEVIVGLMRALVAGGVLEADVDQVMQEMEGAAPVGEE